VNHTDAVNRILVKARLEVLSGDLERLRKDVVKHATDYREETGLEVYELVDLLSHASQRAKVLLDHCK